MKDLVIFGTGEIARMAFFYFNYETDYRVKAFTIDYEYIKEDSFLSFPIIAFDEVDELYPIDKYDMFIAIGYKGLNTLRAEKYKEAKGKGYNLASYISRYAYKSPDVKIGDNCFILEHNVIQYGCKIGNDVMMWSGNHIGHGTIVEDHVYIASHAVISGFCNIGPLTFIGVNATLADKTKVPGSNLIGANTYVSGELELGRVYAAERIRRGRDFDTLSTANREIFDPF